MIEVPERLQNGAEVREVRSINNLDSFVVLAYWEGNYHPWVTWRMGRDGHTYWGHYFETEEDARENFMTRNWK